MPGELKTREKLSLPRGADIAGREATALYPAPAVQSPETECGLLEVWNVLWRRKVWILAFAAAGSLCGLLAAWFQPAHTRLRPMPRARPAGDSTRLLARRCDSDPFWQPSR